MARLALLVAEFGEDIPYVGALANGFPFRGRRVPFLNYQKGIYRAAVQTGPAALSIQTSSKSPYDDEVVAEASSTRIARVMSTNPTIALFAPLTNSRSPSSTSSGRAQARTSPIFPCFVRKDDPAARDGSGRAGRPPGASGRARTRSLEDPIERRYAVRETRVRLHQARFRGRVVPAYSSQCAICRLKELRLLDAAHILSDTLEAGEPTIQNGLSLCAIHHRAFDQNLVGVSPDYVVYVSRRLLEDEDGPMLDLLKGFHELPLVVPKRVADRPDRERLDTRFARFVEVTA